MTKTTYNVHIFREMRLFYPGIEATTHDEAARLAAAQCSEAAAYVEPCDGHDLGALIDVVGDPEYQNSKTIDFPPAIAIASYDKLLGAAQCVLENWERGDLAAAVRNLATVIAQTKHCEENNSGKTPDTRSHLKIHGTPYTIDVASSDSEYLYVELMQGVTVVIKATDEGIVIDAFPQHTQEGAICEPVATTWATWADFVGEEGHGP